MPPVRRDKPPRTLRIGPHLYDIQVGGEAFNAAVAERPDDYLYGRCFFERHLIVLNPESPPAVLRDTLLHEVMHACYDLVGHPLDADGPCTEEQVILATSTLMLMVLQDNPGLVAFLTTKTV